ncbi:MAG: hypothetical protein ACFB22_04540 [Rhodothalassiaceae bacterium]
MRVGVFALAAGSALLGSPAVAQDEVFSDFYACDVVRVPEDRLACFDAVLKKQKLIRGLADGSAESAAAPTYLPARPSRTVRATPLASIPEAQPPAQIDQPAAKSTPPRQQQAAVQPPQSAVGSVWTPDSLPDEFETTITAFDSNSVGDYKFKIAEGVVFEDAGGQKPRSTLSNKRARFFKNFLGQWRMEVEGVRGVFFIRPVET